MKYIRTGTDDVGWQQYVDAMKHLKPEEYLAGDIEGYRRGWSDGEASRPGRFEIGICETLAALGGFVLGAYVFGAWF